MIHLISLNPSVDTSIVVDEFGGRDVIATSVDYFLASKCMNSSKALNLLNVEHVSHVFLGKIPVDRLPLGDHRFYRHGGDVRQNFSIYERSELVSHIRGRANAKVSDLLGFLDSVSADLRDSDFAVLSGSLPKLPHGKELDRLKEKLSELSCQLILDTAQFDIEQLRRFSIHTLKVNDSEFASIVGLDVAEIGREALCGVQSKLGCRIVVTRGPRSTMGVDSDGRYFEFALANEHVASGKSKIGSGDIFLGGYIASQSVGEDFAHSVRSAISIGALHQSQNLLKVARIDIGAFSSIRATVRCT